jgi:imidazolonepropionase
MTNTEIKAPLCLRGAAAVVTLAGSRTARSGREMSELRICSDWSVICEDGKIAYVGPDHAIPSSWRARRELQEIDCRGATIMPALIDAHTHVVWGGSRRDELEARLDGADYEAIFAAGGGILSSVRQTRDRSEDALVAESLVRIRRMMRCGTMTLEIKSGYGLDLETELRQLRAAKRLAQLTGLRVLTTCLAAHAIPEEARGSAKARQAYVDSISNEILPAVVAGGLADFCDVFCDQGALTVEESRYILIRAKALGLKIRVHANELGQTGGALLAAELRAHSADHLLYLNDHERRALAEAGVVGILLPGTSTVLSKPFADGRALIAAGVPVAVATDCNPGSCAFENLSMVLALACYGNRLSPAQAICAVTHNAAASLGLADVVGRIAPGLAADLLVLDTPDYRDLVYHAGSPLIRHHIQAGQLKS